MCGEKRLRSSAQEFLASVLVMEGEVIGGDEEMNEADGAQGVDQAEQTPVIGEPGQPLGINVDYPVRQVAGYREDLPVSARRVDAGEEAGVA